MKKYVIIEADYNDGDCVSRKTEVEDSDIEVIKKVCKLLKKDSGWGNREARDEGNNPYRFVENKKLTEEEVDLFSDLCPSHEYGIHSIESVELLEVVKETELL